LVIACRYAYAASGREARSIVTAEDDLRLEVENLDLRRLLAQAGIDAAEQKVLERLQRLLVEELHHRVKNMLAMVMAITSQSLRTADSLEQGRQAIEQRLMALGRVHDLLLKTSWTSAKLAAILKTAIDPFDTSGVGRFFIQSSDIDVSSGAVLPLAMVLNELCTNAVKYGALSNASGRVEITAAVDDPQQQFRLTWTERDGPPVRAPTRRSFGTRLIEHSFVNQLKGQSQLTFEPSGVVCVLDIPLESLKPSPLN
jgi:two-component sensor histidine kinase